MSRGEDNRQHIVEVATQLFHQRGYNQTSFRDIAEASGIPKGNFYYYFKTKDQLLDSVVEHRLNTVQERFRGWEAKYERPIDRLKQMAGHVGDQSADLVRYGCPVGALSVELAKSNRELKQRAGEVFRHIVRWLEQQFTFMGKNHREAENLAREFLGRIQGIVVVGNALEDQGYILNQSQKLVAWLETQ